MFYEPIPPHVSRNNVHRKKNLQICKRKWTQTWFGRLEPKQISWKCPWRWRNRKQKQRTTESNTTTHACRQTSSLHAEIRPIRPYFAPSILLLPLHTSGSGCTIDDARQQLSSHQHHHLIAIPSSIIHTLIIAFGVVSWSLSLSSDPFYRRLLLMRVAPAISYEFFGYVTNRHRSIARETGLTCMRKRVSYRNIYPSRIHCMFDVRKKAHIFVLLYVTRKIGNEWMMLWRKMIVRRGKREYYNVECRQRNVHRSKYLRICIESATTLYIISPGSSGKWCAAFSEGRFHQQTVLFPKDKRNLHTHAVAADLVHHFCPAVSNLCAQHTNTYGAVV